MSVLEAGPTWAGERKPRRGLPPDPASRLHSSLYTGVLLALSELVNACFPIKIIYNPIANIWIKGWEGELQSNDLGFGFLSIHSAFLGLHVGEFYRHPSVLTIMLYNLKIVSFIRNATFPLPSFFQ